MLRFDTPTVLLTRPRTDSDRFVAELATVAGPFRPLIYPAFEYTAVDATIRNFDAAIFTSRAGVLFAPPGNGRTAYCVGRATADAAHDAGYRAISANGTAADLTLLILDRAPEGQLLHIRGEVSIGDIAIRLGVNGLLAKDIVAYRKKAGPAPDENLIAGFDASQIIVPLFSAETVSIIGEWDLDLRQAHGVAISAAVADAAKGLALASRRISDAPDLPSMVATTARMIA